MNTYKVTMTSPDGSQSAEFKADNATQAVFVAAVHWAANVCETFLALVAGGAAALEEYLPELEDGTTVIEVEQVN